MNQNPRYSADVCSPVPHWTIQFLKQKASTFSLLSFPLIWRWNSIPVHALNYSPTLVSTGNEAQTRTLSHQNNYSVIIPNHTTPPPPFINTFLLCFAYLSHAATHYHHPGGFCLLLEQTGLLYLPLSATSAFTPGSFRNKHLKQSNLNTKHCHLPKRFPKHHP